VDQEPKPPAQPEARYDYERMSVSVGGSEEPAPSVTDGALAAPPIDSVRRRKSVVREYVEAIAIAILLALVIRTLIVQAFTIPSGSMMDTLLVGDYILVNKALYGQSELPYVSCDPAWLVTPFTCHWNTFVLRWHNFRVPHRGDIIVFKYPSDEKRDFIKRIIGNPGDTVQVRGQQVLINGQPLDEPYVRRNPGALSHTSSPGFCGYTYACEPLVVPADSYFVMGDNRDNSQDSRYWGFVKRDKIKGKAFLIYWSWDAEPYWPRWWRLGHYIP
jgi:signal peptidase I